MTKFFFVTHSIKLNITLHKGIQDNETGVRIEDRGGSRPASLNPRKIKHILDTNNDIDFLTSLEPEVTVVYYPNLLMSEDGNN